MNSPEEKEYYLNKNQKVKWILGIERNERTWVFLNIDEHYSRGKKFKVDGRNQYSKIKEWGE